jgi:hypothetical protein
MSVPLHHGQPYPHAGGCPDCREERVCNFCGKPIGQDRGRCTNGRCSMCHAAVCGKGAAHGFGNA